MCCCCCSTCEEFSTDDVDVDVRVVQRDKDDDDVGDIGDEEADPIAHEDEVLGSNLLLWSMRTTQSPSRVLLGLAGLNADEYNEEIGEEQLFDIDEAEPSM